MPEPPQDKHSSEIRLPQEAIDKIILLLVSGLARSAVEEAVEKLELEGAAVPLAIAEAKMRIAIASRCDRDDQLGTALVRLNDIYRRSLAVQDVKTALAVQKELNRLLKLHRQPASAESPKTTLAVDPNATADAEIAAARAHLAPLKLGNEKTPLAELCRLAVLKLIESEHGRSGKCLQKTSRTDRKGPERAGS